LQQRPPTGIWGGLWSFPECPPDTEIAEWIVRILDCEIVTSSELDSIRHTFSHFQLDIRPVHVQINKPGAMVGETDRYYWYSPGGNRRLGFPAPVKILLDRF